MSEMIDRVARALYECPGSDLLAKADHAFPIPAWENADSAVKDDCRVRARAAIEAMRTPTEAMQRAWEGPEPWDRDALTVWQTLIDAALREP